MNYGTNSEYQSLMDSTGKYNPFAKEFKEIFKKLSGNAVKVYIYLIMENDFPDQRTIAEQLGMRQQSLTKIMRELASFGLLKINGKEKSKSRYELNLNRDEWGVKIELTPKVCQIDSLREHESDNKNVSDLSAKTCQISDDLSAKTCQSGAPSFILKKNIKKILKKRSKILGDILKDGPFDGPPQKKLKEDTPDYPFDTYDGSGTKVDFEGKAREELKQKMLTSIYQSVGGS